MYISRQYNFREWHFFFNFPNTLKGVKNFPTLLIPSPRKGDSTVLFVWVFLSLYFPTPDSRKVDKSLAPLSQGGFWCQIPWRRLSFQGFILKGALCCELRRKTNTVPLAGKREAEVARAKGVTRLSKTLERDQRQCISQEMETCASLPNSTSGGWPNLRRKQLWSTQRSEIPSPGASSPSKIPIPKSAAKHPDYKGPWWLGW